MLAKPLSSEQFFFPFLQQNKLLESVELGTVVTIWSGFVLMYQCYFCVQLLAFFLTPDYQDSP